MKKVLLLLVFMFIAWNASSQYMYNIRKEMLKDPSFGKGAMPSNSEGLLEYKEVFTMEGLTKEEIYNRAVYSMGKMCQNYIYRITVQDEQNLTLIGDGHFEFIYTRNETFGFHDAGRVKFSFSVECRDGRYRIVMKDFLFYPLNQVDEVSPEGYKVFHFVEPPVGQKYYGDCENSVVQDKKGRVSYERVGIITSFEKIPQTFGRYMQEPVKEASTKPVTQEEW